jgi:hypothetical protein
MEALPRCREESDSSVPEPESIACSSAAKLHVVFTVQLLHRLRHPRRSNVMPEKKTREAAARDKREGKSASTQAGEYVKEEIEHVREGKHGVKSTKQAIAIGLSKARRAGVKAKPSKTASKATKKKAAQDTKASKSAKKTSTTRSAGAKKALKTASRGTTAKKVAGKKALSTQAKKAASRRTASSRSAAAKKAARTKGPAARKAAAKKAARTRKRSA